MRTGALRSFAGDLRSSLNADDPGSEITHLVRQIIASDPQIVESEEQAIVRSAAERLDVSADGARLTRFATDVATLIEQSLSPNEVDLLLELIAERSRAVDIVRKYMDGRLTRTSYLSFLSSQRWPQTVKLRLQALNDEETVRLATALEDLDVDSIRSLVLL